MRLRAWNPAVIRECLLTWDVETGENICSSDPCRSSWASALFSRRNILPGGSSRLGRPRPRPALPCLAAGGPCVSVGNEVTYQPACHPSLARIPCSMRCYFQMCFPWNWCWVFFFLLFFSFLFLLSLCLAEGHSYTRYSSRQETGIGVWGQANHRAASSPSSASNTTNCYRPLSSTVVSLKPPEPSQALSPGARGSWLMCQ